MKFPILKKLFILLIIICVVVGNLSGQTRFTPPEGNPYSPMNIFIIGATYQNGNSILAGTEVGVFGSSRPDVCVGAAVLPGAVNPTSPVEIKAHKDDGENNGFLEGDGIIYRLWDPGIQREYELSASEVFYYSPETGDPIAAVSFIGMGTAAVEIRLSSYLPVNETELITVPTSVRLLQNFPNPFNPSTTIAVDLPERMPVKLDIFDIKGRHVNTIFDGELNAGTTRFMWNGSNSDQHAVASGIYLYRLTTENSCITKKMLFQK